MKNSKRIDKKFVKINHYTKDSTRNKTRILTWPETISLYSNKVLKREAQCQYINKTPELDFYFGNMLFGPFRYNMCEFASKNVN